MKSVVGNFRLKSECRRDGRVVGQFPFNSDAVSLKLTKLLKVVLTSQ